MADDRWHQAARTVAQATRGNRRDLTALRQASEACLATVLDQVRDADPRAALLAALGREAALERERDALKAAHAALAAENAALKERGP